MEGHGVSPVPAPAPAPLSYPAFGVENPNYEWNVEDLYNSDDNYDFEQDHRAMIDQTIKIAKVALEFYYEKEGVRYVLDEPLISINYLIPCTFVYHVNFTAKKFVDTDKGNTESSSPPSSQMFFAEAAKICEKGFSVLSCVIINPNDPEHPVKLCKGCRECPSDSDPVIYHPDGGCKYGQNDIVEHDVWTPISTPPSSPPRADL